MYNQIMGTCGSGKSLVLLNKIVENPGKKYLVLSNEMNAKTVYRRLVNLLGLDPLDSRYKITICEITYETTLEELIERIEVEKDNYDIFLLDNVDIYKNKEKNRSDLKAVSKKLKDLSRKIQKEIHTTMQLGRPYPGESIVQQALKRVGPSPEVNIQISTRYWPSIPLIKKNSKFYKFILNLLNLREGILVENLKTGHKFKIKFKNR